MALAELDLDYSNLNDSFRDITRLAAKVAGTEISWVNLIDAFTQWTIANYGFPTQHIPREDSICQFTILEQEHFEVNNLKQDERFKKFHSHDLGYYFGVPLRTKNGFNIGSLCVLDSGYKSLGSETVEMLKIIADEIVNRLVALQVIQALRKELDVARELKTRVAHDIRGPITGLIQLAQYTSQQDVREKQGEVMEALSLIQNSATSLLDLTDEILNISEKAVQYTAVLDADDLNLEAFQAKLQKLYLPQAKNKALDFTVSINPRNKEVPFPKNKLLQIVGNLIANAIKFTPAGGTVEVFLTLAVAENQKSLYIRVRDTGIGLPAQYIEAIFEGEALSTSGTQGERGFGLGLPLVKLLVDSLKGTLDIQSTAGEGTVFTIQLPMNKPK